MSEGERITVPAHLLSPRDGEGDHYVLRVVGDSMIEESICDGDFVIVLRRHQAESGEMVVARVGGEDTIKRYYREGVMVRHPCLRALRFPADQVQIKGIVVDLMRKF